MKALYYTTDHIKAIIAILVIVSSFGYFFITYFIGKAQSDPQIIIAIVGAMTTVLAYYFGSSQGASRKDETISEALGKKTNQSQNVEAINTEAINVAKKP